MSEISVLTRSRQVDCWKLEASEFKASQGDMARPWKQTARLFPATEDKEEEEEEEEKERNTILKSHMLL